MSDLPSILRAMRFDSTSGNAQTVANTAFANTLIRWKKHAVGDGDVQDNMFYEYVMMWTMEQFRANISLYPRPYAYVRDVAGDAVGCAAGVAGGAAPCEVRVTLDDLPADAFAEDLRLPRGAVEYIAMQEFEHCVLLKDFVRRHPRLRCYRELIMFLALTIADSYDIIRHGDLRSSNILIDSLDNHYADEPPDEWKYMHYVHHRRRRNPDDPDLEPVVFYLPMRVYFIDCARMCTLLQPTPTQLATYPAIPHQHAARALMRDPTAHRYQLERIYALRRVSHLDYIWLTAFAPYLRDVHCFEGFLDQCRGVPDSRTRDSTTPKSQCTKVFVDFTRYAEDVYGLRLFQTLDALPPTLARPPKYIVDEPVVHAAFDVEVAPFDRQTIARRDIDHATSYYHIKLRDRDDRPIVKSVAGNDGGDDDSLTSDRKKRRVE